MREFLSLSCDVTFDKLTELQYHEVLKILYIWTCYLPISAEIDKRGVQLFFYQLFGSPSTTSGYWQRGNHTHPMFMNHSVIIYLATRNVVASKCPIKYITEIQNGNLKFNRVCKPFSKKYVVLFRTSALRETL